MDYTAMSSLVVDKLTEYGRIVSIKRTTNVKTGFTWEFDPATSTFGAKDADTGLFIHSSDLVPSDEVFPGSTTIPWDDPEVVVTLISVYAVEKKFSKDEWASGMVHVGDKKFVFPSTVVIDLMDRIVDGSYEYGIVPPISVMQPGSTVLAYEVHCRG